MTSEANSIIHTIKGMHPGAFLARELKLRKLSKGAFAISLQEYPQTLGAITNEKRSMNTPLAMKIEAALALEEGFLMTLQVFHDIEKEKKKQHSKTPDLKKFRRALFWDTAFENINWEKHKRFVIERVFERGNDQEKKEIIRFYGQEIINQVLSNA